MLSAKIANFFSALGDETRIKILALLYDQNPISVSDIMNRLGNITKHALSYQLKILKSKDIIRYHKVGKKRLYYLSDEHVSHILNDVIVHLSPEGPCNGELNCSDDLNLHMVIE
ncbi:ArsR/SmtB family transcription factor [Promethearchaeum syntrophicum]|uniref:ArsR/SmtB family transcription factor n=1 Tax=Promethearchaeum syntrophicum TaxID=2594042 RepID=A0A5B9DH79_9ARCH|nr:metalloregulator ArsR/SmtB family transcription factor [Candidatus Prometheoarchaeum syntrophicum]QEE18110.1 Helix-turn-helix domain protein [Candidatus Prometheoarchaeum syntrophicum]